MSSPLDKCSSIDKILGEEVDEFEELVIGYFVVYVFLDFVKEGNLLWRGKGLRGGGTG